MDKQSKSTPQEGWLTKTRIGLITGGFAFLLLLTVGATIAFLSCRKKSSQVPYKRQRCHKGNWKGNSVDRTARGTVNPATDVSQYEMNDRLFKVQEVSWDDDGKRQVDDLLVMYNNPLFSKRNKVKRAADTHTHQLTLDNDWNVVFDL